MVNVVGEQHRLPPGGHVPFRQRCAREKAAEEGVGRERKDAGEAEEAAVRRETE